MRSTHTLRYLGVTAVAAAVTFGLAGPSRANPSSVEGCHVAPINGSTETCQFVAHAPDEIVAAGAMRWKVTVQRRDQTQVIGEGDSRTCLLEGSLSTDRQMAMCVGRIMPGDVVTVEARGTGTVTVANAVCDHDALCREP